MSIALESQPLSPWGAACARLPSTKPSKHRSQRRQGITAVLWTTLANARVGQRENRRFDPRRAAEHRATGISGFRHAPAIRSPARWRIAAKRRSRWTYARWVRMLCRHNGSDHRRTPIRQTRHRQVSRSRRSPVCQIIRSRCAGPSACTSRISDACDHVGRPARRIRGLSNGTGYVP